MSAETVTTAADLVHEVDAMRAYVMHRMWGYRDEVDNVMQEARLVVWKTACRYDPDRGTPNTWVFAIVSRVVMSEVHRLGKRPATFELQDTDSVTTTDCLDDLVEQHENSRWLTVVADAASEIEWSVVTEIIRHDGDTRAAADALRLPIRTARAARDRARALIHAARTAYRAIDTDMTPTTEDCLPDSGGLREAYVYRAEPVDVAAGALGIAAGVFRTRRALCRRIDALVSQIVAVSEANR